MGGAMKVRCVGGMLDGQEVEDRGEATIHQHGLKLMRVYQPYPKRKGLKVIDRLMTISEEYAREETDEGLVYRCKAPFGGFWVGDESLEPEDDGHYKVFVDRDGKLHARLSDME